MNVTNSVDEIRHIVRKIKAESKRFRIDGDVSRYPELEAIRSMTPATFTEMIVAMEGAPLENVRTLIAAYKEKLVKIDK